MRRSTAPSRSQRGNCSQPECPGFFSILKGSNSLSKLISTFGWKSGTWYNHVSRGSGQQKSRKWMDTYIVAGIKPLWHQLINLPECAYEAGTHGERGDIIWFGEGPVVGGKGPSKRTLPQCDDKVDTPEKSHSVVDLQVEQIPLEETLFVVFDENAAGWGAAWIIWWVEVLRRGDRRRNEWIVFGDWTRYIYCF